MADGMTALDLAADLGMLQPDDVVGERTAPAPLYWGPGHPRSFAGDSPTAGECDYDEYFDW